MGKKNKCRFNYLVNIMTNDLEVLTMKEMLKRFKRRSRRFKQDVKNSNGIFTFCPKKAYVLIDSVVEDTMFDCRAGNIPSSQFLEMFILKLNKTSLHELIHLLWPPRNTNFYDWEDKVEKIVDLLSDIEKRNLIVLEEKK